MNSKIKEALEKREAEIAAGIIRQAQPLIRKPSVEAPLRPDFAPNPVFATPLPRREPVERRKVDEFFKQPRKAAIYQSVTVQSVNHGLLNSNTCASTAISVCFMRLAPVP